MPRKKQEVRHNIGPLEKEGTIIDKSGDIAEALKEQYESVFSIPQSEKVVTCPHTFFGKGNEDTLHNITFSQDDVRGALSELSSNSAPGPDNIPAKFLLNCRNELARPLHNLFQKSLSSGEIPEIMKEGIITPIFKGGSRGQASNYRPVVLTSHIMKTLERIVKKKLIAYLEEKDKLNPGQHGFRRGRSCLSQLLEHQEYLINNAKLGKNVDVIYLDFAKAFDKVDHGILLHKLRDLGIQGKVGVWLHSFLSGRKQAVRVEGVSSKKSAVKSGVPQGSVLGPVLFLLMIGDINDDIKDSKVSSFADDTRISRAITSEEDAGQLQADLNKITCWATENNMDFNKGKFELIRYGRNNQLRNKQYYVDNQQIEEKESLKDLGVLVSNDFSPTAHIESSTKMARRMSGWILRTFQTRDPDHLLPLWKSLVLPRMEYLSQLWSPHKAGEIKQLEQTQRVFTRKLAKTENQDYWQRLKTLQLYSLQRRRERYCIIYTWKILEQLVPNPSTPAEGGIRSQHHPRLGRTCLRRSIEAVSQRLRTIQATSFTNVGPRLFNCLPRDIRDTTNCSTETFKKKLDSFLQGIPDEPPILHTPTPRGAESNSILDQLSYIRRGTQCRGGGLSSRPW